MDDLIKFTGRSRPLSQDQALARLREAGVTEAESITALGATWHWKRERTGKALKRWADAGRIEREDRPNGTIIIRWKGAVPGNDTAGNPAVPAGKPAVPASVDVPAPADGGVPTSHTVAGAVPYVGSGVPANRVERLIWPTVDVPVERPTRRDYLTLLIALALATVSGGFSIYGMTSIFVGALWPVIAMGAVLECAKLRAVALICLGRGSPGLRLALAAMVGVLMMLNAVGAFGFLSKAHIGREVEGEATVTARLAAIDGRIAVQSATLADVDRRLSQIDGSVEKAMSQGRTNGAMQLADDQRHVRTGLQVERMAAGKVLAELKVEKARIEGQGRIAAADLGPIRYLAAALSVAAENALRWFILVVALLLDPAALLLMAATSAAPPRSRAPVPARAKNI